MTTKTTLPSKIWLSSPHMGGTEQKYVQQAFDTNWIAPLGPNVNGFENDLANYIIIEMLIFQDWQWCINTVASFV